MRLYPATVDGDRTASLLSIYLSMASPTVMLLLGASFAPPLMAAAWRSTSFLVAAVMEIRWRSTIMLMFQLPEGSFVAFGIFTSLPSPAPPGRCGGRSG